MEPIIRMIDVKKNFGNFVCLEDLYLEIGNEEKLVLMGPSGGGKSTILRILMTLEPIDSGMIEVEGESVWTMETNGKKVKADEKHLRHIRSKYGMVFQQFNLFPHMNVRRNVTQALVTVLKMSREESNERAENPVSTNTIGAHIRINYYTC